MSASVSPVSFDSDLLICVDEQDRVVGHLDKTRCHDGEGQLHRALSVFLFNAAGEVLLQQRSASKRLWPLWWANSCCSHPRQGEEVAAAAHRRLAEELGVHAPVRETHRFVYHARFGAAGSERELCYVYVARSDAPLSVHPDEIAATRWWQPTALDAALRAAEAPFTPWLRLEWQALRETHWARIEALLA